MELHIDLKIRDGKFKKLMNELGSGKIGFVKVGVLHNVMTDDGLTVAYIGALMEFGSDKAGRDGLGQIPERSWLRDVLLVTSKIIQKNTVIDFKKYKQVNFKNFMRTFEKNVFESIRGGFDTGGYGMWVPLKESTIAKKGHATILVDVGLLRDTISSESGVE